MFTLLDLNPPKIIDAGVIDTGLGNNPVLENLVAWYNRNFARDMQGASFQYAIYAFGVANRKKKVFCRLVTKLKVSEFQVWKHLNCLCCSKSQQASFKN